MSLNSYINDARHFLEKINAANQGASKKIQWLEEELSLLKDVADADDRDRIRHQIYDMLFLLFEISADYDKERKEKKYINAGGPL